MTLPIVDVQPATPRACIVRLDLGDHDFPYEAGQAVLVGMHGDAKRRPYSIAGSPDDARRERRLELLVGVERSATATHHSLRLDPGATLDVEGPVGRFTFPTNPNQQRFTFIAGGTGIAPLRAMLRRALELPDREISVLYSARTPEEFAYHDELAQLAHDGRIRLRQTVTRSTGNGRWRGLLGRIGPAELQPIARDPQNLCFICGPKALVDDTTRLLNELGAPRERIRIEEW